MSTQISLEREIEDWDLLAQVCRAYRTLSDRVIDEIAMHRAQAALLCQLYVQDGSTQSEIANMLGIQGATATNMLKRMEEAGLITRERDPDDNRLVRVYLTEAGKSREHAIKEQFVKVESTFFAGIDESERVTLRELLQRMLQNVDNA